MSHAPHPPGVATPAVAAIETGQERPAFTVSAAKSQALQLLAWRRLDNSYPVVGTARVRFHDLILGEVRIIRGARDYFVDVGSRPQTKGGQLVKKNHTGFVMYERLVGFVDRDALDRFTAAVVDLIRAEHPDDLGSAP